MKDVKILVVDDSPEFNFLLNSLLKFHKVEVDASSEPFEALEKAKENAYQLIITD